MLLTSRAQLIRPLVAGNLVRRSGLISIRRSNLGDHARLPAGWNTLPAEHPITEPLPDAALLPSADPHKIDPLYLFACHIQWESHEEPSAAWELLAAAQSPHPDTRAHARALLASSRHFDADRPIPVPEPEPAPVEEQSPDAETTMKAPYGLDLNDDCTECTLRKSGFFCGFSDETLRALNLVSHKSILPAGAILFVEGQAARGLFIICSGKVNLSTTSREGKILILKTVEAGEVLGLSAAISNVGYEATAETATPCQLNFVDRKQILDLLETYKEVGVHVAHCLSRDFQSAYRDIHGLVMTRSSAGKLARLLLSHSAEEDDSAERRVHATMTHEEMAQRIGSSRETVTRLLSDLKRKQLIRSDGSSLVIRDRCALEALAV